jgi:CheY-like chemotaxis protein
VKEIAPDLPRVWADPNQLQQVLVNLITNAKQAMAEREGERRLTVTMGRLGDDRVQVRVTDCGPGIPADLLPRIFDPFVTTKGASGTGLGLSISYGIIREHGGTITADSRPSQGATFTIELPVGAGAAHAGAAPAATELTGKRILIVEPEDSVQRILLEHLEPTGSAALAVSRAEDAHQHLQSGIDLVVAELNVTGIDWLGLLRQAAARPGAGRRFVFLAPGPVAEEVDEVLRSAGSCLLYKPFTGEQLVAALRHALAG